MQLQLVTEIGFSTNIIILIAIFGVSSLELLHHVGEIIVHMRRNNPKPKRYVNVTLLQRCNAF